MREALSTLPPNVLSISSDGAPQPLTLRDQHEGGHVLHAVERIPFTVSTDDVGQAAATAASGELVCLPAVRASEEAENHARRLRALRQYLEASTVWPPPPVEQPAQPPP